MDPMDTAAERQAAAVPHLHKDLWDKLGIIATLLIPIVVALAGVLVNSAIKDRDIRADYVRLALDVLQSPDSSASAREVKKWAFNILSDMSPVPMPPALEADALGIQIMRASYRTGGGFGDGWGFVEVRATGDLELFVYVDNELCATTPATLNLPTGRHSIELRTSQGHAVGAAQINLLKTPVLTVTYAREQKLILLGEKFGARMSAERITDRIKVK